MFCLTPHPFAMKSSPHRPLPPFWSARSCPQPISRPPRRLRPPLPLALRRDQARLKIIPGQVIVPTGEGEMRRIWGELVSLDIAARTGNVFATRRPIRS